MKNRHLGKSNIEVSPLGLGCMPIGGRMLSGEAGSEQEFFLGEVNDKESIRAIHKAYDAGVNFYDTAPAYGAGHSEMLLGQAFSGRREKVIISTKFGKKINEERNWYGHYTDNEEVIRNIRLECEASLLRLKTDYIDLYLFHLLDFPLNLAVTVQGILEELVLEGKIRFYGWSTNDPERARLFAQGEHCSAIMFRLNVLEDTPELLSVCDRYDLAGVIRGPLASGFLTGKYTPDNLDRQLSQNDYRLNYRDDIRKSHKTFTAIQDILKRDGRTMVQGALAWIWSRSNRTIPIPGFRTMAQVEENIKSIECGPLEREQIDYINEILKKKLLKVLSADY